MNFKTAIDKFVDKFDESIFKNNAFKIKEYEIFSSKFIRKIYDSIDNNIVYDTIKKKILRTQILLDKYIVFLILS